MKKGGRIALGTFYLAATVPSLVIALMAIMAGGAPRITAIEKIFGTPFILAWMLGPVFLILSAKNLLSKNHQNVETKRQIWLNPFFPLLYISTLFTLMVVLDSLNK